MADFISDAEMAALESRSSAPDFIPDDQMAALNATGSDAPWWGKAASGYLSGIAGMADAGELANIPSVAGRIAAMISGEPTLPSAGDNFRSGVDWITGVQGATKIGEGGFAHTAASYVPGAVLGPENVLKNALQTAAMAGGAGAGRVVGGPIGELFGSLAGAVSPIAAERGYGAISNFFGPQSEQAALKKVGESLGKFTTADDVTKAIAAATGDPLLASKSSAEILASPELSILEQQMGTGPKSLEYAAAREARIAAQADLLSGISAAQKLPKEYTGQIIQDAFESAAQKEKDAAQLLYGQIPGDVRPDTSGIRDAIAEASSKFYGPGSPAIPGAVKGRINFLNQTAKDTVVTSPIMDVFGRPITEVIPGESPITIEALQNARSHLGEIARVAQRSGNGKEAGIASAISDSIAEAISKAPEGSAEWKAANAAYAQYAERFKQGPLKKIADALPSTVFNKVISSPEAAAQAKSVLPADTLDAIKDQIASELSAMTEAAQVRFINGHESELKTLLPNDFPALDAIRTDITSRIDTQKLANATRGSNTALKLSTVVERALTGKDPKPGLWSQLIAGTGLAGLTYANPVAGIATAAAGVGAQALKGRSTRLVQDALYEALMNPKTLEQALATAGETAPSTAARDTMPRAASAIAEMFNPADSATEPKSKQFQQEKVASSPKSSAIGTVFQPTSNLPENTMNAEMLRPAVIQQESGGKAHAVSDKGALGLMQIMPDTAKDIARELGIAKYDLKDPETNKKFGTYYLQKLLDMFGGDPELALTAYHSGPNRVAKLLKVTGGNSLADIIDYLGPVGKIYAAQVMARLEDGVMEA